MYIRIAIGALIGGAIGLGLGYFGKCAGGACPLMGNPVSGTIIGALIGGMIATIK